MSTLIKFYLQPESISYEFFQTKRGEGVNRFCYVTGGKENRLTLRPVTKGGGGSKYWRYIITFE